MTTDLDARYGRSPARATRSRVITGVAIVVFAAVVIAWVVWVGLFSAPASLESRTVQHTIIDDSTVEVVWDVSAPPGTAIGCVVQALNESFGTVGWKIVEVPPSDQRTRTLTETLRTSEQAVTGLMYRCWLA